jgi:hypothetical protein
LCPFINLEGCLNREEAVRRRGEGHGRFRGVLEKNKEKLLAVRDRMALEGVIPDGQF